MLPAPFPELIHGTRIHLKKHQFDDAEQMFSYVDQDRSRLRQFLPWVDFTKTIEDEEQYIQITHEDWEKGTRFDYGIFLNQGEVYLGNVGLHTFDWKNKTTEIGYWLLGRFEGKGYMSEAVNLLTETCFAHDFEKIEIRCDEKNEKSAAVPKRCGYTHQETIINDVKNKDGNWRSTCIFAKHITKKT